ncbi:MAG TPA: rod shape-determining protein MreC, partial [Rubrobacteraceae bacterium]|nr:rod shape-determining protein MreC [Rubrobacteraceae bacterium]
MGRKKSNAASGLAGLVILCIASLVLFTIYVREDEGGPLHTVQLGAAEVLRPLRSLLNLAASPVQGAGDRIGNAFDGSREAELERRAREYEEDAAEAAGLRQENERLRRLLEAEDPAFDYAPLARVVAPVGDQLSDKFVINVGTEDGVKPEQPVVVGDNVLVGRTTSTVTPHTAEVMLITDQDFAAGVRLVPPDAPAEPPEGEAPYGQGLLQTGWEGYLGVNYVDLEARVEKGDFVVTSGRAGDRELLFPPGLLVGTVETVTSLDIDQYQKIVVEPTVRPADLQEVRVVVG